MIKIGCNYEMHNVILEKLFASFDLSPLLVRAQTFLKWLFSLMLSKGYKYLFNFLIKQNFKVECICTYFCVFQSLLSFICQTSFPNTNICQQ